MSELATELSRRVDREHVKEFATEKAGELKVRAKALASEKAGELKEQAKEAATEKATEIKDRAREAVMTSTTQIKERADTSKGWSLLGAMIGAGVGAALMKKAFEKREEHYEGGGYLYGRERRGLRREVRPYDVRTATGGADIGDLSTSARVGESPQALGMRGEVGFEGREDVSGGVASQVKERAEEMKERVKDKAYEMKDRAMHLRERIPDRGELRGRTYEVRGRASDWFERTLDEQPILLALGGIAVGMLASSLVPVSRRERRLIEPTKHRVEERISEFGERISDKLKGSEGEEQRAGGADISGAGVAASSDRSEELASPTGSRIPPLPPLDDVTKLH